MIKLIKNQDYAESRRQRGIKSKRQHLSITGFSLVETMVTLFIFSFLFAALFMVLSVGQASWFTTDVQTELNQGIRRSLLTMTRELRQTRPSQINIPDDGNPYNSVIFRIPEDTSVPLDGSVINSLGQIEWSGDITYSLIGNQIIRNRDGANTILANNITNLEFRRVSPNIIEITITAQRNTAWRRLLQADITSGVMMRN